MGYPYKAMLDTLLNTPSNEEDDLGLEMCYRDTAGDMGDVNPADTDVPQMVAVCTWFYP